MTPNDQIGGLPATTEETEAVLRPGTKGNVSVAGLKGVSLEAPQSSDIRERLMQMIAEREGYGKSMQGAMEHLALAGSAPGEFTRNYGEHMTRNRQREQDLLQMRMGVAQLASEEARVKRLAQERAQWAQRFGLDGAPATQMPGATGGGLSTADAANTMTSNAPSTGGLGINAQRPQGPGTEGQPAGGLSAVRPQTAFTPAPSPQQQMDTTLQSLPPAQKFALMDLQYNNPTKFSEQLISLTKPTDLQRELSFLTPEAYQTAALAKHAGSSAEYVTVPDPNNPGFEMRVPRTQLQRELYGISPRAPGAPAGGVSAPTGSVAMPAPGGAAAAPATPAAAPAAPVAAGPAGSAVTTPNPYPRTDPRWAQFEEARGKANINVEESAAKNVGEGDAKEISRMSIVSDQAKNRVPELDRALEALDSYPSMFGRLMKPTLTSTVLNALSQGVSAGRLGNIGFPGVNEYSIQLDPVARKDPKAITAWYDVAGAMNKVLADYTAIANEGQGQVSNSERQMYRDSVGDASRIDAEGLKKRILVARLNYQHTREANEAWNTAQRGGERSLQRFKASPAYQQMQERQYYESAKALGVKNPKFVRDGAGEEDEAAALRRELRGQ
jgi:hypothetical protein